jgi:hypothetical protein
MFNRPEDGVIWKVEACHIDCVTQFIVNSYEMEEQVVLL